MFDGGDNSMAEVENCKRYKEYPTCCLEIIKDYNLFKNVYPMLYVTNKFILTISILQVSHEHCFSALKFIENRLRGAVTEEHLRELQADVCRERNIGKFNARRNFIRSNDECENLYPNFFCTLFSH